MVRAHRGIASKLPKGHWLFRLCFDPPKHLSHPTFMPQIVDCLACTALCHKGSGGNSQRSLLKSKIVIGRLGGGDHREQRLRGWKARYREGHAPGPRNRGHNLLKETRVEM